MRSIVVAFGLWAAVTTASPASAQSSSAEVYAKYPAPVGHRQPSVLDVERGRAGRETRETDLNELARQIEGGLRERLKICRGC